MFKRIEWYALEFVSVQNWPVLIEDTSNTSHSSVIKFLIKNDNIR